MIEPRFPKIDYDNLPTRDEIFEPLTARMDASDKKNTVLSIVAILIALAALVVAIVK